jgi:hypothetical protein
VDETAQKVIVASTDGQLFWTASQSRPGEELKITLPQPGSLRIRYDIPDEPPKAQIYLFYLGPKEALPSWKDTMIPADVLQFPSIAFRLPPWTNARSLLSLTLSNGGETNLANLASGWYLALRRKNFPGTGEEDVERRPLLIAPGQSARWDIIAVGRQRIRGAVAGLAELKAKGGEILVRSANATGQPWKSGSFRMKGEFSPDDAAEFARPTFDKLSFGQDGRFETAMLKPGTYAVIAQAHPPEERSFYGTEPVGIGERPWVPSTVNPPGDTSQSVWGMAQRNAKPDYIGVAKVTVTADSVPAPVTINLAQAKYADIAGRAVDEKTLALIPDLFIQVGKVDSGNRNQIAWESDYQEAGGLFLLENVEQAHAIRFLANGWLPQVLLRDDLVASRNVANIDVQLKRGREYHGTVVDHSRKPAIHVEVIFAPLELAAMPGPPGR